MGVDAGIRLGRNHRPDGETPGLREAGRVHRSTGRPVSDREGVIATAPLVDEPPPLDWAAEDRVLRGPL